MVIINVSTKSLISKLNFEHFLYYPTKREETEIRSGVYRFLKENLLILKKKTNSFNPLI